MMIEKMKELVVQEEGQGLTEYGLILAVVAVVAALLATTLDEELNKIITTVKGAF